MRLLGTIKLSATWAIDWCEDNAWIQYLSSWSPPEPFLSKTSRLATLDNFVVHVSCPMSTYTCWLCTVTNMLRPMSLCFQAEWSFNHFQHQMMRSPCFNHQWIFHEVFSEVQATTAPAHPMSWIVLLHWSWRYTPGLALNNLIPLSFKSWYGSKKWFTNGQQWSQQISQLYQYIYNYISQYVEKWFEDLQMDSICTEFQAMTSGVNWCLSGDGLQLMFLHRF